MPADCSVQTKAVELCKHVLRMTTKAGSGHPSSAVSLAHIVVDLMYRHMRHDPADPWHRACDRLVLSEGHAVPIIYAAWADLGGAVGRDRSDARKLTPAELSTLRELDSVLDGHPNPAEGFPFFDAATGSLGQGLSVAAGLAIAAKMDGTDRRVFVLVGDGESREGQIWEAMDFIAGQGLTHVCVVFNCNGQGQADDVSGQQSPETIRKKAAAFGWEAVTINGHDPQQVASALSRAGKGELPLAVVARTIKGWGSDALQEGNHHGKPLTADELEPALRRLDELAGQFDADQDVAIEGPPPAPSSAPTEPTDTSDNARSTPGAPAASFPAILEELGLADALQNKKLATRVAYGAGLVALGQTRQDVISLDADVNNSTYASLFKRAFPDRFIECKIAEQNMLSTAVGLSAAGKIPFVSTFAKFASRAYDQIEMACISRANVNLVGSHAGVSLGADGPSQMSLPDVAYFRSMTRVEDGCGHRVCHVFHPADAVCAFHCVALMASTPGLCYLRTHRPTAPFLYDPNESFELGGCKQLREGDRLTLVSAGYMLHTVLKAAGRLAKAGIAVNVFDAYTLPLDAEVILDAASNAGSRILTIEDNYAGGLHAEFAEAAARRGNVCVEGLTVSRIPKSAKTADEIFDFTGIGLERIIETAQTLADAT